MDKKSEFFLFAGEEQSSHQLSEVDRQFPITYWFPHLLHSASMPANNNHRVMQVFASCGVCSF